MVAVASVLISFTACDRNASGVTSSVGRSSETGRISWEIDGVRLGQNASELIRQLGQPLRWENRGNQTIFQWENVTSVRLAREGATIVIFDEKDRAVEVTGAAIVAKGNRLIGLTSDAGLVERTLGMGQIRYFSESAGNPISPIGRIISGRVTSYEVDGCIFEIFDDTHMVTAVRARLAGNR